MEVACLTDVVAVHLQSLAKWLLGKRTTGPIATCATESGEREQTSPVYVVALYPFQLRNENSLRAFQESEITCGHRSFSVHF